MTRAWMTWTQKVFSRLPVKATRGRTAPRRRATRFRAGVEPLGRRELLSNLPAWAALGISDSDGSTVMNRANDGRLVENRDWAELGVRRLRAIAPYDVAVDGVAESVPKARFDAWYAAVEAYNKAHPGPAEKIEMAVSFQDHFSGTRDYEQQHYPDGRKHAPLVDHDYKVVNPRNPADSATVVSYASAIREFLKDYPDVGVIGPWNEANVDHELYLKDNKHKLQDPHYPANPTTGSSGPYAAAYYWAAARDASLRLPAAQRPVLVAGEFATDGDLAEYTQDYKKALIRIGVDPTEVKVWGVHPYADVLGFQDSNGADTSARATRSFLESLYKTEDGRTDSRWKGGHVWLTAVGAYYRRRTIRNGTDVDVQYSEGSQAGAAAFILRLPSIDRRITRIYYYDFRGPSAAQDFGVIDFADGHRRKAYQVLQRR